MVFSMDGGCDERGRERRIDLIELGGYRGHVTRIREPYTIRINSEMEVKGRPHRPQLELWGKHGHVIYT